MPHSVIDQIESAFGGLSAQSAFRIVPKTIHQTLPNHRVGISELRSILMHPSVAFSTQDEVFCELIRRAQRSHNDWTTVVIGMLLPGLRPIVSKFTRNAPSDDREDIAAEIVTGLVGAIHTFDFSNTRGVPSRILWAGFRSGLAYRAHRHDGTVSLTHDVADLPDGHPDLVLDEAVEAGVITPGQAWLIAETRLGEVHLPTWAESQDVSQDTMRHRRAKAERQLRAWISGVGE